MEYYLTIFQPDQTVDDDVGQVIAVIDVIAIVILDHDLVLAD